MDRTRARSLRRARRILMATTLGAAVLPVAAVQAAEVTAAGTEIVVSDTAGPFGSGGETNRLIADLLPGGELRLADQVPLVSKTDTCVSVTSTELRCIRPSTSPISRLTFRARAGNDQLRPSGTLPIRFEGGEGDDLYVGARTAEPTRVDFVGGIDGGDAVHYTNARTGVHVNKDDVANDGRPTVNDRDNIRKDVDVVIGTQFDDRFGGMVGLSGFEEFRPLNGDDVVFGGDALVTRVDMGAAADGADRIVAGQATEVSYAKRTNPVRAGVDLDGADDGETGEGDELVGVRFVVGGSGDDTLFAATRREGTIVLDGGPGADRLSGTDRADKLIGGLGRDILGGRGGNDELIADDGDVDQVLCGDGFGDVARTDTAELAISGCETRITP